ncbi:acyltransferase [Pontibacter vulgaris]|uniref:acyltransferase n=1 Tax=Pontibacter vulgaris TaxID=2905679 RepID=UPI001FA710EE|nr:acyltransferase [Pontibacter vulgaris]
MIWQRVINLYRKILWTDEQYARHIGVKIGDKCSIATRYFGSEPYLIEIGNHVQITSDVRFFTHGGGWVFREEHPSFDCFGKIKVGNNVYIGNCSMIMPGVSIGDNVVIGAGTIVTRSIENNCVVVGNPGRVVGEVKDLKRKLSKFNTGTKMMGYVEKRNYLLALQDKQFMKK